MRHDADLWARQKTTLHTAHWSVHESLRYKCFDHFSIHSAQIQLFHSFSPFPFSLESMAYRTSATDPHQGSMFNEIVINPTFIPEIARPFHLPGTPEYIASQSTLRQQLQGLLNIFFNNLMSYLYFLGQDAPSSQDSPADSNLNPSTDATGKKNCNYLVIMPISRSSCDL